jgi:hypothetical protein
MDLDVDVGKIAEPPKIMCFVFYSILSSNSLQWTEIHDVAKFDAVPILSEKIPLTVIFFTYYESFCQNGCNLRHEQLLKTSVGEQLQLLNILLDGIEGV